MDYESSYRQYCFLCNRNLFPGTRNKNFFVLRSNKYCYDCVHPQKKITRITRSSSKPEYLQIKPVKKQMEIVDNKYNKEQSSRKLQKKSSSYMDLTASDEIELPPIETKHKQLIRKKSSSSDDIRKTMTKLSKENSSITFFERFKLARK